MVSNAFVLCKVRHNVSLSPCHAMEPRVGIEQNLTEQLMRYSEPLQGVVLSFSDVQLAQPHGVIVNEMPYIHCKVLADALVFRPLEGMQLRGVVNKIGSNHVGMLFAGVFNGSVAESELPKGYVHNYAQDCWLGEDGSSISVEDEVDVKVLRVHVAGGMIAIEATMRFEGASIKKATSVKKVKKAVHLDLSADEPATESVEEMEVEEVKENKKEKKQKKEKKSKKAEAAPVTEPVKEVELPKKKKSKKTEAAPVTEPVKEVELPKKKEKKNKRAATLDLSAAEPVTEPAKVEVEKAKKKKEKKSKAAAPVTEPVQVEEQAKVKKTKKVKKATHLDLSAAESVAEVEQVKEKNEKKSKKRKHEKVAEEEVVAEEPAPVEEPEVKPKKHKLKDKDAKKKKSKKSKHD
ncbi:hypothetical protein PF005_g20504 [Phytophthora fragariae]|uniref:DNA-directed RNA polymerase I subunit RPA43 n=1 Tax=Phytophthora fragariae TaxID=53985 RepID=A0A6A3EAG0_9STRA|nr:hypothetical protein PF003_g19626 [Phytophthora fragariae]KAE8929337.1 hypothetical protein PF009_g20537 [Phytophthora fragariae]KAE9089700.1 hypothetical protein PF007_g19505 [Phytophthora fragariae]KAE9118247.1 hypothetical protein PF006_g18636 [Phytophthora fragariae]KAE9187297.1 hypothetical protein PF005_g20504 [Phytophthora fragariae]